MAIRWLRTHRGVALLAAAAGAMLVVSATAVFSILSGAASTASANPASGFVSISAGERHTCALTSVDGVKCWGDNETGQLGNGTYVDSLTPVDVSGLSSGVQAISSGAFHTCALTTSGGVKCWGDNYMNAIGDGGACGVYCNAPVDVTGLTSDVASIGAGYGYSCAVTTGGTVKCWGANASGTPVDVAGLSGAVAVAGGNAHTCALTSAGGVKCWGANSYGQLGDGTTTYRPAPVDVSGLTSGVSQIDAGDIHTCAVTQSGGLKCWGDGPLLGHPNACGSNSPPCSTPVDVTGLTSGVAAVSAARWSTCALTTAGAAKCWSARNEWGQVGDGTVNNSTTPVQVLGLTSDVTGITTNALHTCAVMSAATAKCWGDNTSNQLGAQTTDHCPDVCSKVPIDVLQFFKPTATFTPGSPTNTPTPTPTPTPIPCPPACGLDFSIGVDASISGAALPCDSSGSPTATCDVPLGAKFKVSFYVHSLASGMRSGVSGEDETVQYAGITSSETQDSVNQTYWPSCVGATGGSFSPGQVSMGCSVLLGPPSTYVGKYSTVEFTCTADGSVTLVGGTGYTDVADDDLIFYSEASDESLTIRCVPPQAYPGDTDGDGCPDAREQGMNPMMGGRRNFLNPWDYMNPTGDHMNRVDDILAVIPHFGQNVGDLGYDVKYDRTYLGPNRWNLGPPDGKIRVADILAAVSQYGQDCF